MNLNYSCVVSATLSVAGKLSRDWNLLPHFGINYCMHKLNIILFLFCFQKLAA